MQVSVKWTLQTDSNQKKIILLLKLVKKKKFTKNISHVKWKSGRNVYVKKARNESLIIHLASIHRVETKFYLFISSHTKGLTDLALNIKNRLGREPRSSHVFESRHYFAFAVQVRLQSCETFRTSPTPCT